MTVELKSSSGYLVDHERSISIACGSLLYTCIEDVFNTYEPYGQAKSREQIVSEELPAKQNDSLPWVCDSNAVDAANYTFLLHKMKALS